MIDNGLSLSTILTLANVLYSLNLTVGNKRTHSSLFFVLSSKSFDLSIRVLKLEFPFFFCSISRPNDSSQVLFEGGRGGF